MALVEKKSKYIVLLSTTYKSQDIKIATLNWLNEPSETAIYTIILDRREEFSKWKEIELESKR